MNELINEGRIEYKAIVGFKAVRKENGLYRIYVYLKNLDGKVTIRSLNTCKGEQLYYIWEGIRSLANILTTEDFFMTI